MSPELKHLFRSTGLENRPSDVDRERILNQLQSRLGIATPSTGNISNALVSRNVARSLYGKATIVVAGMALIIGGIALLRNERKKSVPEVVSTPNGSVVVSSTRLKGDGAEIAALAAATVPTSVVPEVNPGIVEETPKTISAQGASRRVNRTHDNLTEEAGILSRAQSALHSGHAESALQVLAEHERRFKYGILAQERTAVRIQALCALGRVNEANTLLRGLSPKSLTGESARQACAKSKVVSPTR
jgi:hypothetical protein